MRAELHAQLADWIEARVGDAAEHDETIGWHLEQAHQLLRELGPLDESAKRLGERAAARLAAAGRRALGRDDVPVAANLLGRAIKDEPHGSLSIAHSFGTLADGGAFESVYAMIMLYRPDGIAGAESFELDDLEAAKARFEALRAASE